MNRKDAIEYLERKEKLDKNKATLNKAEEDEVQKVMKQGKIYGDPLVEVKF